MTQRGCCYVVPLCRILDVSKVLVLALYWPRSNAACTACAGDTQLSMGRPALKLCSNCLISLFLTGCLQGACAYHVKQHQRAPCVEFWHGWRRKTSIYVCVSPTFCIGVSVCKTCCSMLMGSLSGPRPWYFVWATCVSHKSFPHFLPTDSLYPRAVLTKAFRNKRRKNIDKLIVILIKMC